MFDAAINPSKHMINAVDSFTIKHVFRVWAFHERKKQVAHPRGELGQGRLKGEADGAVAVERDSHQREDARVNRNDLAEWHQRTHEVREVPALEEGGLELGGG